MPTSLKEQRYRGDFIVLRDDITPDCGADFATRLILRVVTWALEVKPCLARRPKDCNTGILWWRGEGDYLFLGVGDDPPAPDGVGAALPA